MVIGIDASRANRPHRTGTEWYSYYLIKWMAELDSENQYILYTDTPIQGDLLNLNNPELTEINYSNQIEFDEKGFQKIKCPHNNFKAKVLNWPFRYLWTQGRLSIEMIFNKPDILFIPSHTLPIIYPKKSAVTIHDIGFMREKYLYDNKIIGPENSTIRWCLNFLVSILTLGRYRATSMDYLCWSTNFALKHAKKIITVSNFSKQEILDVYGADSEKIKVIYNGYNTQIFNNRCEESEISRVLKKYGLTRPYILYVGRLEKKKNTPALIEAYCLLKEDNKKINHKLLLIGNASYGYDEVNYTIREFGLEHDVVMPGWIEEADMKYIYCGASIFVFPSKYEGFGIPLLQAMACGVPIAASWESSIPEIAEDVAVLFNPNSSRSIAQAINQLLSDDDLRQKAIENGNERIKLFSWKKSAQETLDLLINM